MQKISVLLIVFSCFFINVVKSQDSISNKTKDLTTATFKTSHLVIGQSIENVDKGHLNVIISHHFGKINDAYNFFGLDQSTIRLGVEYGITNRLEAGIGRSSFQKTVDGYVKYKILRQDNNGMPLGLSYFGDMAMNTVKWTDPSRVNYFSSRLSYVNQLIVARKFSKNLSFQLMPTQVHKNLVPTNADQNNIYAVGGGGRFNFTQSMSVNAEYYYLLPGKTADDNQNSLSLGVDLDTGGHVFQLFFTNSQPLFERGFITESQGKWAKAEIFFGFNIIRTF